MCEKACEKGIKAIAFTDHIEVDCYYEEHYDKVTVQAYFAEKILNDHKYDIILGSIHNLRGEDDFCFLDYFNNDVDEILNEYFDEICGLADWGKFDSLAHLTYPLRYIEGEAGIHVDLSKYSSKIDEALRTLAEKDRALEINTSGLFNKIGKTLPEENIVRRFRELGGKLVTIRAYDPDDKSYESLPDYHVAGTGPNTGKRFVAIYPTDLQCSTEYESVVIRYKDLKDYLFKIGEGAVNSPLRTSDSSPAP